MGCDIHSYVEVRHPTGTWVKVGEVFPLDEFELKYSDGATHTDQPFDWRSYGMFGFLADVRNSSCVPVIVAPRGLPTDLSSGLFDEYYEWADDYHSASWLTAAELLAHDYDQTFENRRVTLGSWGAATCEPGLGQLVTYREFLGDGFVARVKELCALGDPENVRVVFWFDN